MIQQIALPEDELARKADAIRLLSLGLLATAGVGEIIVVIVWLFNPSHLVIPFTIVIGAIMVISSVTYWLGRSGHIQVAGFFFVVSGTLLCAIITTLFGGFTGPLGISYLFPILAAGMVISVNASFLIATLATLLYLAMIGVEQAGLLNQLIAAEVEGAVVPYLTVAVRVLSFYLIASLSWFAASRLNQALNSVRRYAYELKRVNEQLRASEEELRVSNEELRATEEELRAANEELRATNEELRDAQEKLVRSERLAAIGQLAGGVGHELRNPLGAIKNAIYYVRGKVTKSELVNKDQRVMEFLDIIDDEISSSGKIINDLLGFSRVGKPAVSPARIEKVIDDTLSYITIPQNIQLIKKLDTNLPEIKIDTDQVRQVLVNMILNAVQAMPDGGKLTISAREKEKFLEVEVTDSGCGIPQEVTDKIFDPLFTTRAKGIGLGLAVCKAIIDRQQGDIEVESEIGKGTTFTVKLPLEAE
jgi:signal transduction histidine kinase